MQINVAVQDANNIVCEVIPPQVQTITIDRGVEGNGIVSIVPVTISTFQYLRITYTNGTVSDVGPLTSTAYTATSPITIVGNTISLGTVPVANGGTGLASFTSGGILYASSAGVLASGTALNFNGTSVTASQFLDTGFTLADNADITKKAVFELSGLTTGTTYTYTLPALTSSLASLGNLSQTFLGATTFAPTTVGSALTIGSTNGTGAITLGRSTVNQTLNIGTGATTAVSTKTINIGTAGVSGSTTNITIGSAVSGALVTHTWNAGANNMTLNTSGNLGLGVTPSAWSTSWKALQVGLTGSFAAHAGVNAVIMSSNVYDDGGTKYITTGLAAQYQQSSGVHYWYNAASGTAGNAITFTQAMTLDAGGNLGLGATTTTGGRLVISQSNATQPAIYLPTDESTIQGPGTNTFIKMGSNLSLQSGNQTTITAKNASGVIVFQTGATPTEWARITPSGYVGIGTESPSSVLYVAGATNTQLRVGNTNALNSQYISIFANSSETIYNSVNTQNSIYGSHIWQSTNNGGTVDRAKIDSSGNFMVGTTSPTNPNPGIGLAVGGNAQITIGHDTSSASGQYYEVYKYNGSVIGGITQNGTSQVLYNISSDYRLKENIVDAPDFGSVIDSIQVRSFNWKTDQKHQRAGFIAQELVTVAPEAVHQPEDTEEMMAVDYSKLVPMLVKEIQSLRKRLAAANIA
jgi:hypothetical protein